MFKHYTNVLEKAIELAQMQVTAAETFKIPTRVAEYKDLMSSLQELKTIVSKIEDEQEPISMLHNLVMSEKIKDRINEYHVQLCELSNLVYTLERNGMLSKSTIERIRQLTNEP